MTNILQCLYLVVRAGKKKHYNSELDEKVRNKFSLYNIFLYDIIILFIFAFTKYFATYKIKKNIEL